MLSVKQLPAVILSVLCLMGSGLWVLFCQGQKGNAQEVFSFETERLADQIFRTQLEGELGDHPLPEEILGFGIYNASRYLVHGWGDTPETLPEKSQEKLRSVHFLSGKTYEFTKILEPLGMRPRRPPGPLMTDRPPPPMQPLGIQGFLYMRIKDDQQADRLFFWDILVIIGPLFWTAVLVIIGRLWYRNRQFQQTLRRNQELLQYTEAARTLSHEIKNPLSAILLQTALLKKLPEGHTDEVRIIEEETRRISHLVERVRDFLKDPRGDPAEVDIHEIAASLRERFSTPISLTPGQSPGWMVRFDPSRLRSVLENLMKNACESGPDPQPAVRLTKPKTGWIRMEITDSGPGLSPEALGKAFTPFFTQKTTGTGIGLSIARDFVTAAGGKLTLGNRIDGPGAVATVEIPLSRDKVL